MTLNQMVDTTRIPKLDQYRPNDLRTDRAQLCLAVKYGQGPLFLVAMEWHNFVRRSQIMIAKFSFPGTIVVVYKNSFANFGGPGNRFLTSDALG